MKTPRQILLERHRAAEPELDAIRSRVLARELKAGERSAENRSVLAAVLSVGRMAWLELFWSCRRVWLGLATLWVAIVALHFLSGADVSTTDTRSASVTPEQIQAAWNERQRLLTELKELEPEPAEPPKSNHPQPRSETRPRFYYA